MIQSQGVMSQERLDRYIDEAAKAAGYAEGFGVRGCEASSSTFWAAYTRQSLKEQAENDRLAEYFLTCARLARQSGVVVPRENVIYDADSSEDFNRPGMIRLRSELIAGRRIAGVIIPAQGRLSMDPLHQLTFEKECDYYSIRVIYGDAPGGNDWASQTTRLIQAQANALRVKCNRDNALGGNITRVLAGKVPAQKAPYGYIYRAEKTIEPRTGRARVLRAWWEINELTPDRELLWGSPGWVVNKIYSWIGDEGRTQYWVTSRLNEMNIKPMYNTAWAPKMIGEIVRRKCYTGKAEYNANGRVPNPDRPLGDLTLGIKKTLLRPKPEEQKLTFDVPTLTSDDLWRKANDALTERGRGRGKRGRKIAALFRGRMLCPLCQKPMSVLRDKRGEVYYFCRPHYCRWVENPCSYNHFVPGTWDEEIWDEIGAMLGDDTWIEQQLSVELRQDESVDKLIRLHQFKIKQGEDKIRRVEEGFDGGLYSLEDARKRKANHLSVIEKEKQEISRLQAQRGAQGFGVKDVDALRQELRVLRQRNLKEASFEEKADLVAKLGIKVYPSEDLRSRRISCRLNLQKIAGEREQGYGDFAKVVFGEPSRIRTYNLAVKCRPLCR